MTYFCTFLNLVVFSNIRCLFERFFFLQKKKTLIWFDNHFLCFALSVEIQSTQKQPNFDHFALLYSICKVAIFSGHFRPWVCFRTIFCIKQNKTFFDAFRTLKIRPKNSPSLTNLPYYSLCKLNIRRFLEAFFV